MTTLSAIVSTLTALDVESVHVMRHGSVHLVDITTRDEAQLATVAAQFGAPAPRLVGDHEGDWYRSEISTTDYTLWLHSRPVARSRQ